MRENQMLLDGNCSIGIPSNLTMQRYIKNLKKQNFLIKKKPSQWKKYPPTRKIKKMRFRIAKILIYEALISGISAMHITASQSL